MKSKQEILNDIRNSLIVSCQALEDEPLYCSTGGVMPLMALAAKQAGAHGIRANSVRDIIEIKQKVNLPVIGIIKREYKNFEQYITATMKEIDELIVAKADIIAFDCTLRDRPDGLSVNEFIRSVKEKYPQQVFMADISTLEEGINASREGIDLVGTTLCGYTDYTNDKKVPDFKLIKSLSEKINVPVIAEGNIHFPDQARMALEMGAFAVVVGGAITRPKDIAKRFIKEMNKVI